MVKGYVTKRIKGLNIGHACHVTGNACLLICSSSHRSDRYMYMYVSSLYM